MSGPDPHQNGRSLLGKGQSLFSTTQVSDFVSVLELPHILQKSVLQQKYLKDGVSIKDLALEFECGKTTIKKYLKHFGIKKGGHSKHRHNLALGEKIEQGKITGYKAEQNIVRTIVQMYEKEGLGARSIARVLDTMKIPTKRQGKKWDHSVIIGLLIREGVYKSLNIFGGMEL